MSLNIFHPPAQTNLIDLVFSRAQQSPEQLAYIFLQDGETETERCNYQQLVHEIQTVTSLLRSITTPEDRVVLLFPSGLDFIASFLGCLYAQVIAIPAYPPRRNQRLDRIVSIIQDATPSLILTSANLLDQVRSQLDDLGLSHIPCLSVQSTSSDLTSVPTETPERQSTYAIDSDALAFLQYTSGSTGKPKGVMISHDNIMQNLAQIQAGFQHSDHASGVSWLPPYHDMGLIGGILQPLYIGRPMILMPPVAFLQKPIRWLQAISKYRATTSGGPNFAYDLCIKRISSEKRATLDLSCWEVAFNGAEPIRADTLKQFTENFTDCGFRAQSFYPCYGMAETTLIVSGGSPKQAHLLKHVKTSALNHHQVVSFETAQHDSRTLVSSGRSLLTQEIIIVDPNTLVQCDLGQVGEVWVAGKNVAQGYWQQPLESQKVFNAYLPNNPEVTYLRTGDWGFLDNGELFITGRLKDIIVIRGRNHYPQDIELTVQQSHPSLRAGCGAAFSVDVQNKEQLVIVQELERSYLRNLNSHTVFGNILEAVNIEHGLQVYQVILVKTGSIPKTSSGKIKRYACKQAFLNNSVLNIIERGPTQ